MIELKDLLVRFESLLIDKKGEKDNIVKIIKEVVGVLVSAEDLKVKQDTVYITAKPIIKNEIFLKKDALLQVMQQTPNLSKIKKIQ